ncbi:hypothetical protein KEM48_002125 [Puccinia striiformis f. sp. tritici PST-130]|uniref:Uncharacterized protein n=3 Tax=Puccinia striiformis TaxID=27350 RepID=A0A0L0VIA7_9BASI|nr:hypothetical protein KEM48_002125 [Puccinia striiformis f. sp. tritici PST-130]KNE99017.1 hypothetical protein PSTG_07669 [Puccinia striiformis f. sp. tritici PST-78]POV96888.1 hypothetical protein PSTT_15381 [Puccinia striiformis]
MAKGSSGNCWDWQQRLRWLNLVQTTHITLTPPPVVYQLGREDNHGGWQGLSPPGILLFWYHRAARLGEGDIVELFSKITYLGGYHHLRSESWRGMQAVKQLTDETLDFELQHCRKVSHWLGDGASTHLTGQPVYGDGQKIQACYRCI